LPKAAGRIRPHNEPRYDSLVVRRLYVNNFRCLQNFELVLSRQSSVLLIGKNGSGKTTISLALEILQKIARGTNRARDLITDGDFGHGVVDAPIRFEIEVELNARVHHYVVAFEFPTGFKELRICEEKLSVDGQTVFSREASKVHLDRSASAAGLKSLAGAKDADFGIDWHLVALPILQEQSERDPIFIFRRWLARMLVLRPMPSLISGDSREETLQPDIHVTDFGAWFAGLVAYAPSAYAKIDDFLRQVMPDLKDIKNPTVGKDSRSLVVQFSSEDRSLTVPFVDLSDGEKCFMVCALVLAANEAYGPLLCFWDEPDSFLALSEVGHFTLALRKAFQSGGQFIATSHNPEAIRSFSDDNTLYVYRENHLEPTRLRRLSEMNVQGDLIGALVRDDLN
jgi:predicted ATPase